MKTPRRRKFKAPWPFVKIPRLLIDLWMPILTPAEFYTWCYIFRRTIGYQKDWEHISYDELASGQKSRTGQILDGGTGFSKSGVRRAIALLEERGLLDIQRTRNKPLKYSCKMGRPDIFQGVQQLTPKTAVGYHQSDTPGCPMVDTHLPLNSNTLIRVQTPIENIENKRSRKISKVVALPRSVDR